MSNINDLIQQYCPNGCEYKSLSEISDRIKGMTGVSNKWAENGNCQFIDYLNAYNHLKIDVSLRPFATVKKLEQMPLMTGDILITSASETPDECALSAVIEDEIDDNTFLDDHLFGIRIKPEYKTLVNPSYVNYYFHSKDFRKILPKAVRGVTRYYVSLPEFMELEIPVPPLPVQEEIVRILDKFTELEQELEQELELRKKQYEYYRDKMLSLSDYDGEVEEVSLGSKDYFTPIVGGDVPKDAFSDIQTESYSIPIYSNGVGDNALYGWTNKVRVDKPCITLSARGTIGYCAYHDLPFYPIVRLIVLLPKDINKINAKFLYYAVSALTFVSSKSGIAQLTVPMLDAYKIKVPDITEQNHIVDVLDKFSTLISDISEGLPAEIKMRHQQYEYYRDKLLNFKRLEVA